MSDETNTDTDELFEAAILSQKRRLDDDIWILEEYIDEVETGSLGIIDVNDAVNSYLALCFSGKMDCGRKDAVDAISSFYFTFPVGDIEPDCRYEVFSQLTEYYLSMSVFFALKDGVIKGELIGKSCKATSMMWASKSMNIDDLGIISNSDKGLLNMLSIELISAVILKNETYAKKLIDDIKDKSSREIEMLIIRLCDSVIGERTQSRINLAEQFLMAIKLHWVVSLANKTYFGYPNCILFLVEYIFSNFSNNSKFDASSIVKRLRLEQIMLDARG